MRFEASMVVKSPRDRVYSAYTDFGAAPKWSSQTKSVSITKSVEGSLRLEVSSPRGGPPTSREVKLYPPERVESEGETRFTRSVSVVRFEGVPEGTRVTASLDVRFKGLWGWVLRTQGKAEAESAALAELASFARYVEEL